MSKKLQLVCFLSLFFLYGCGGEIKTTKLKEVDRPENTKISILYEMLDVNAETMDKSVATPISELKISSSKSGNIMFSQIADIRMEKEKQVIVRHGSSYESVIYYGLAPSVDGRSFSDKLHDTMQSLTLPDKCEVFTPVEAENESWRYFTVPVSALSGEGQKRRLKLLNSEGEFRNERVEVVFIDGSDAVIASDEIEKGDRLVVEN